MDDYEPRRKGYGGEEGDRRRGERFVDRDRSRSPGWRSRPEPRDDGFRERERGPPPPSSDTTAGTRVYVHNLSYDVQWRELKDFMREAGDVVYANVILGPDGRSKGSGVVEFRTPEMAARAIRELHETPFMGRPIYVREDRIPTAESGSRSDSRYPPPEPRQDRRRPPLDDRDARPPPPRERESARYPPSDYGRDDRYPDSRHEPYPRSSLDSRGARPPQVGRTLAIKGLPTDFSWQDLKDLFRPSGRIERADVFPTSGRTDGTGMVVFSTLEEAQNAIATFDGFDLRGQKLSVQEDRHADRPSNGSRSGPERTPYDRGGPAERGYGGGGGRSGGMPSTQIFVKNLPYATSTEDLRELFLFSGQVIHAELQYDDNRQPRGFAIVEFDTVSSAEAAIAKFNRYDYGGRSLTVEFNGRFRKFG